MNYEAVGLHQLILSSRGDSFSTCPGAVLIWASFLVALDGFWLDLGTHWKFFQFSWLIFISQNNDGLLFHFTCLIGSCHNMNSSSCVSTSLLAHTDKKHFREQTIVAHRENAKWLSKKKLAILILKNLSFYSSVHNFMCVWIYNATNHGNNEEIFNRCAHAFD